jgi:hypothetical protein
MVSPSAAPASEPTFFARRDYAFPGYQIVVADVNGDKIPDIVGLPGGNATALLGNGNGTFRQGPGTNIGVYGGMAAADLNGDGKIDLVVAGQLDVYNTWGVGVSFGNGDGTFQPAVFYPAADSYLNYVVLGDFNGDGIEDAVTVGAKGVWLFAGEGGGVFSPGVLAPMGGLSGQRLAAADFNGDGALDLAITTLSGFIVLLGNGDGTFQPAETFSTAPYGGRWITVGELTADHHPDIVLVPFASEGSPPDRAFVYLGDGAGGFSRPSPVPMPGLGQIAIGDVNGDHIPDLVSSLGYIALGNGDGTFKPISYYPLPTGIGTSQAALGDFRNNGLTDIAFQDGDGEVSVLLNLGGGKYEDGLGISVPAGAGCGAAADFNGDGKPDLAVNGAQGVSILLGTGSAKSPFATGTVLPLANADCLVTGDLNGDGIPDLLVPVNNPPPATGGAINAYLGNGDGTFTWKGSTPTSAGGYIALADFNRDGKLAFATAGNLLALGNGDGTFQTPIRIVSKVPYGGFTNIAAGDLNGDGWPDLVITSFTDSYIYVLINNQHGGFTATVIHAQIGRALLGPTQVLLSDLRRGGNLDMVVADGYGGGAAVYIGDGNGSFTYKEEVLAGDGGGGVLAVSDVNGDSIPDIVMTEGGTVAIFLGKGDATFADPYYIGAGPSPGDLLTQNLHGQASSAGLPDIVVPDVTGGVMILINTTK